MLIRGCESSHIEPTVKQREEDELYAEKSGGKIWNVANRN